MRNSMLWASLSSVWRLALYSLVALQPMSANSNASPNVHRRSQSKTIDISQLPSWSFLLHGWALGQQEDAGEFLAHILQRVPIPHYAGIMVLNNSRGTYPEAQPFTVLTVPVPADDGRREEQCLNHIFDL